MSKFGRKCELSVEINPTPTPGTNFSQGSSNIVIPQDLTIDFSINRQALGSSQEATFRIKNLSLKTRNLIYKDPYALTEYLAIQFKAGYQEDPVLPICFNGFVRSATSYREGVDFITEITAYDGGMAMANGFFAQTVIGQSLAQLMQTLAKSLPGTSGATYIGEFPTKGTRGRVLCGNTWNILVQLSDGLAYIDNGDVKILNYNEAIAGEIPLIDTSSGLLGSPKRTPTMVEFDILFEPRLTLGQFLQLQSASNPIFNGTYKVMKIQHRGTVSPAVAGEYVTSVGLFVGAAEQASISSAASSGQFTVISQGVVS
jgi:hypothetical protein